MVKTIIKTRYCLKDDQITQLIAEGKDKKLQWYMQELTTNQFVPYDMILGIHRVSGGENLNLEFDEGIFTGGMEVKCAVGDYKVVDANGRHCQQAAFFYIDENGQAIPCKYKELPSQNGGAIPEAQPEPVSDNPFMAYVKPRSEMETVQATNNVMPFNFEKVDYVFCEKGNPDDFPHNLADSCIYFDDGRGTAQNDSSACCEICKYGRQLIYVKN